MSRAYFITGTDTGVGKTLVSAALIHGLVTLGLNVIGMKPVAAGCRRVGDQLIADDVEQLAAAGNLNAPFHLINPYAFEPAIAPHIAAQQAGMDIKLDVIAQACQQLKARADVVIVEGVGGFRVPLGNDVDTADLAKMLGMPVILVVGMRLGCLNHALLTAEAIQARGLKLAGWVANQLDPEMTAFNANLHSLQQRLTAPCLGTLPWLMAADYEMAAKHLCLDTLAI